MANTIDDILNGGEATTGRPKTATVAIDSSLEGGTTPPLTKATTGPGNGPGPEANTTGTPGANGTTGGTTGTPGGATTGGGTTPGATTQPGSGRTMSYTEMYKELNPYKPPTEEELKKERKKQKREQIFAAINDGIASLSNLFFTTRGAPNMYEYKDKKTQSQQVQDRWEKLRKEREANLKEYNEGLLRAQKYDDDAADKERKWQRQLGIDKIAAEEKAKKQEREDKKAQAIIESQNAAKEGKLAQAQLLRAKAEAIEAGRDLEAQKLQAQIDELKSRTEKNKKQGEAAVMNAGANQTRAAKSGGSGGGRSGSGSGGSYLWYDADGNAHYEKTAEEAKRRSLGAGTWVDHESTTTTQKRGLTGTVTTRTTRANGGHSQKPAPKKQAAKPTTQKKKTGVNWK